MSLFDSASVVITPSGYKEDKLYSIKPTDGNGDLVVTRATTATRVNSAGLIEVVPRNLLQYSEAISTSPWALVRSTVSTNSINSPTGTLTADTLVSNITGSNGSWTRQIVSAINGNFNMSIYAKQGTSPFLQVSLDGLGAVIFNLSNGTVKLSSSGIIGSITSVGSDGWYRCSISGTATGQTTALFIVGNSSMNLVTWFATNGDSVYLWGAQVEQGSLTEYFPTTDRLDVPRLDYTNSSCPSILVEPQRTNVLTYSEDFSNAAWGKLGTITVTANQTTAPDGNNTADLILGADSTSSISQIYGGLIGVVYTSSFFIKNNNSTQSQLLIRNASTVVDARLNWTGSVLSSITNTTGITTFQSYNNGWYRITSTYTSVEAAQRPRILPTLSTNQSVYLWGAQLEAGSNATSYIPTVASTVTRNADVISKTGISSLIGTTYTVYGEIINEGIHNARHLVLKLPTGGNYADVVVIVQYFNGLQATANNSTSTAQFTINSGSYSIGQTLKYALRCEQNNVAFYINGVQIGVDTLCTIPAVSTLYIGNYVDLQLGSKIKSTMIFPSALTNTELAQLTTL